MTDKEMPMDQFENLALAVHDLVEEIRSARKAGEQAMRWQEQEIEGSKLADEAIKDLRSAHAAEIAKIKAAHAAEVQRLRAELDAAKSDAARILESAVALGENLPDIMDSSLLIRGNVEDGYTASVSGLFGQASVDGYTVIGTLKALLEKAGKAAAERKAAIEKAFPAGE